MKQNRNAFQNNQMFLSGIEKRNFKQFKVVKMQDYRMNLRTMDISKNMKIFSFCKFNNSKDVNLELQYVKNVFDMETIQQYAKMARCYKFQMVELYYFRNTNQPITCDIGVSVKGAVKEFLWSANLDDVFSMIHKQGFLMDIGQGAFVATKNLNKQKNSPTRVCSISPPNYVVGHMELLIGSKN